MVRTTASRVQCGRSSFSNGVSHSRIEEFNVIDAISNRLIGNNTLCCLSVDPELYCSSLGGLPIERLIIGTDSLLSSSGILEIDWDISTGFVG